MGVLDALGGEGGEEEVGGMVGGGAKEVILGEDKVGDAPGFGEGEEGAGAGGVHGLDGGNHAAAHFLGIFEVVGEVDVVVDEDAVSSEGSDGVEEGGPAGDEGFRGKVVEGEEEADVVAGDAFVSGFGVDTVAEGEEEEGGEEDGEDAGHPGLVASDPGSGGLAEEEPGKAA